MRFLIIFAGVFFIAGFYWSCSNEGAGVQPSLEDGESKSVGRSEAVCSSNNVCIRLCGDVFIGEGDLVKKCKKQTSKVVQILKKVVTAIKKGNWKTIRVKDMEAAAEFDKDLLEIYTNKLSRQEAKDMLLWLAEEPGVAEHLGAGKTILRRGFLQLAGGSGSSEDQVLEGMKVVLDSSDGVTFFEAAGLESNGPAFKLGHELLEDECESKESGDRAKMNCMKKFYCDLDKDVVFALLNRLNLADDVRSSGVLTSAACP